MKAGSTMLAAIALAALTGCDQLSSILGGGDAAATNNAQAVNSTDGKDPAPGNAQIADAGITSSRSFQPPPAPAPTGGKDSDAGQAFNASILVGRWGDFGDCSKNVIDIAADGTFRAANGGVGAWQLEGNRLTFSGDQATVTMTLQSLDNNGLIVTQPDGTTGRSQRC